MKKVLYVLAIISSFISGGLFISSILPPPRIVESSETQVCKIDDIKLLYLINEERKSLDLHSLRYNDKLAMSAKFKLIDLTEKNYWDHVAPDGTDPWLFFEEAGYNYQEVGGSVGENLARDFCTEDEAFNTWKKSTKHYENMMDPDFVDFGSSNNGVIIVNHFGVLDNER